MKGYFGKDASIQYSDSFKEAGFVFAPFDDESPAIVFSEPSFEIVREAYRFSAVHFSQESFEESSSEKQDHIELVKLGIRSIQEGGLQKVVLSRKEIIEKSSIHILEVYKGLLHHYRNAFVYVWYHPKIGLWMGATPEKLLTLKGEEFETTALAGTQLYKNNLNPVWDDKEKKEHQYVIDYIVSQIRNQQNGIILKKFTVSDTYTTKAGDLIHLKTDIRGVIGNFELKRLLNALHPTPAVCGLPKDVAKSFIKANENYDRSFYTGFLGEVNVDRTTELYVNLRCVRINKNTAIIYVGGGITAESNPEKEWKETTNKTKTIKKVL